MSDEEVYALDSEDDQDSQVIISAVHYKELLYNWKFLNCLRSAGVDNWEGYEFALDMMEDDDE